MKKFLLLLAFVPAGLLSSLQAQIQTLQPVPNRFLHEERPVVLTHNTNTPAVVVHKSGAAPHANSHTKSLKSLSAGIKLNKIRIGSAGNLLTVDNAGSVQLSTDQTSNSVVFIHRLDPSVQTTGNLAEYDYDMSADGGNTWATNVGPITVNGRIDNNNVNGRFPQGVIYNPTGTTVADSNYLVYSGTWHDQCTSCSANTSTWTGQMRGKAQLDGNASTYTVSIDTVNGGHVAIAAGFCQGAPGVFWNLNTAYTGTFATAGNDAITYGIIVEKGVWNPATKNVSWTDTEIPQQFDSVGTSEGNSSIATSFDIAFDPSGKYGWIACLGDISNNPADSVYSPIFWYSQDSGTTWVGPVQVPLGSLPAVTRSLYTTAYNGATTSGVPTTAFEAKLAVDYLGNPHLFTTVGNGTAYSIQENAGYIAYDINFNASRPTCDSNWNGWAATFVDSVYTLEGTYTTDAVIEYNRPEISRSKDGKKLFFYWLDTDYTLTEADTNEYPNLFTRAFDVELHTSTPAINLTQGDSLFGGSTSLQPTGGLYLPGANFPVIANTPLESNGGYNVGVILTQIDYTNYPDGGSTGSSANPAAFWYINNITYTASDFSNGLAATVTVNGDDTVLLTVNSSYTDAGATLVYLDTSCFTTGTLHLVTTGTVDSSTTGTYTITYSAEDGSGNVYASATRTVIVAAPPVADFTYTVPDPTNAPGHLQFTDASTNQPTSWFWNFGDPSSNNNTTAAESPGHTFLHNGSYSVCLTATNNNGGNTKCKSIGVATGIDNVTLSQYVSLFPNPTTGKVFIAVDASVASDYTVTIYDMLGNAVVASVEHKSGSNLEMNIGSLANGTYMVKIQTAQEMAVKRLELIRK